MRKHLANSKETIMEVGAVVLGSIVANKLKPILGSVDAIKTNPIIGDVITAGVGVAIANKSGKSHLRGIGVGMAAEPIKNFINVNIFKGAISEEVFDDMDIEDEVYDDKENDDDISEDNNSGGVYLADDEE